MLGWRSFFANSSQALAAFYASVIHTGEVLESLSIDGVSIGKLSKEALAISFTSSFNNNYSLHQYFNNYLYLFDGKNLKAVIAGYAVFFVDEIYTIERRNNLNNSLFSDLQFIIRKDSKKIAVVDNEIELLTYTNKKDKYEFMQQGYSYKPFKGLHYINGIKAAIEYSSIHNKGIFSFGSHSQNYLKLSFKPKYIQQFSAVVLFGLFVLEHYID